MAIDYRLLPGGAEGTAINQRIPEGDGMGFTATPKKPTTNTGIPEGDGMGFQAPTRTTPTPANDESDRGFPGGGQLWLVDGQPYLVFFVPNTNPPVPMAWQIRSDEDLQAYLGPDTPISAAPYEQVLTQSQFNARGAIPMGGSTELANASEHPFETFLDTYEQEAAIRPWLRDPEILAITAGAILEGRAVTEAELFTTNWWQTHNDVEREWLKLNAQDPATAQVIVGEQQRAIAESLRNQGMLNPPDDLVNLIAANSLNGVWAPNYVDQQILKLTDPSAAGELDAAFSEFTGLDTTRAQEQEVRALATKWLGPSMATGWDDGWFEEWAGILRNDPDGETRLIEQLRAQRLAMFPEYENPELTYQDIAGPWKNVYAAQWGQQADETDPFFNSIVRMNDLDAATKLLTTEGLKRGVGTVVNNALGDLTRVTGSSVRQADRGIL